ncbi:hypothetical protein IMSHALPRED_007420 [Imshaugia aleurites]|uniref:FAD/NAD(P)-binding domain-containing protein n=1 Tax=Imshaugia aleurites TaxID=172621 RepID=A0A8H3IVD6_9LECA|nr:hypothetical protein IMSHALPRED_007420 [Imshaugia aleurites]
MANIEFDVVVIGAGLSGIAFSIFHLDIHSECKLAILEEDTCVGGVWSASPYHNGFWSQSGLRMSGFFDIPITLSRDTEGYHDIFEAKYVTKYFESYVDEHVYNGQYVRERIYFGAKVREIEKADDSWRVSARRSEKGEEGMFHSAKLVTATGHTTISNMPVLPGENLFQGHILH